MRPMFLGTVTGVVMTVSCLASAPSQAADKAQFPSEVALRETSLGSVLTDRKGMTLYVFGQDSSPLKSACNGECVEAWPPFELSAPPATRLNNWLVIVRDDGKRQWTYQGRPLYRFSGDKKPGDINGEGAKNKIGLVMWHVAKPDLEPLF